MEKSVYGMRSWGSGGELGETPQLKLSSYRVAPSALMTIKDGFIRILAVARSSLGPAQ
jgi:hypothetical protein